MAVLIDTDLLVDLERGVGSAEVDRVIGEQERAISVITVSELLHGVHRATGARDAARSLSICWPDCERSRLPIPSHGSTPTSGRNWPKPATSLALTISGSPRQRLRTDYRSRPTTKPIFNASQASESSRSPDAASGLGLPHRAQPPDLRACCRSRAVASASASPPPEAATRATPPVRRQSGSAHAKMEPDGVRSGAAQMPARSARLPS